MSLLQLSQFMAKNKTHLPLVVIHLVHRIHIGALFGLRLIHCSCVLWTLAPNHTVVCAWL